MRARLCVNWLFAHKTGGKFFLRIDDTDTERSKPEYEAAIIEDLELARPDARLFARQMERAGAHQEAAEKLKASGRLYPAYETADELDRRRKRQIAMHKPPIYDRAALALTDADRAKLEAEGRKPHWRFKLSQTKVKWHDLIRGEVEIDTAHLSDPVLIREDGRFLYTLPSVVDDVDFAVTHIVRGEDHVTNTAAQIEIFEALGARVPEFAHFPLLIGSGGEALSKRIGSLSLARNPRGRDRAAGARLPISPRPAPPIRSSCAARSKTLAREFDFAKIGRAPAHFDPKELEGLNAKLLHALPYEAAAPRLQAMGLTGGAAFWDAVKPNLTRFSDAADLATLITGPVTPVIEDAAFAAKAAELLPAEPWNEDTWGAWTKAVGAATGTKGRALFHPLRLALTGRENGPELKKLLPLIGRARALARLKGETA